MFPTTAAAAQARDDEDDNCGDDSSILSYIISVFIRKQFRLGLHIHLPGGKRHTYNCLSYHTLFPIHEEKYWIGKSRRAAEKLKSQDISWVYIFPFEIESIESITSLKF